MRKFLIGAAAFAALLMPGLTFAQETDEDVIVDPAWAEVPTPEELGRLYPAFAGAMAMSGSAVLKCRVTLEGRLALCEVVKDLPAGLGFGRSALASAPQFRLTPRTVNGDIRKSYVQFTVRFTMDRDDTITPWSGKEPPPELVAALRKSLAQLVEDTGPPPGVDLDNLGVDDARYDEVVAMIQSVEADLLDGRLDAMALAMTRVSTPEQMTAMINGRPPPGPMPEGLEEAGPELKQLQLQFERRLRDLYCARHMCLADGAPGLADDGVPNAAQAAARAAAANSSPARP